jgi:hypothetical protein
MFFNRSMIKSVKTLKTGRRTFLDLKKDRLRMIKLIFF